MLFGNRTKSLMIKGGVAGNKLSFFAILQILMNILSLDGNSKISSDLIAVNWSYNVLNCYIYIQT